MKTYLIMYFGTEGISTTDTAAKLESIGFKTTFGPVDFVYEWGDKTPTKEDILGLGNKVVEALKGSGAVFALDTHD